MSHEVVLESRAEKQLLALPSDELPKVHAQILALGEDPRPRGNCKKLKGKFAGCFRIRIGDFRVLYRVKDKQRLVEVFWIDDRKDSYRGR